MVQTDEADFHSTVPVAETSLKRWQVGQPTRVVFIPPA